MEASLATHCSTEARADVIVVGAGPGGSTAAALLARAGWDVLLLDRADFPRDKTCGDGLTPRAVAVLEHLGLLGELQAQGYQAIEGARVISPRAEILDVPFAQYGPALGLPPLGLVIPRYELDDRLRAHALACGARFQSGVHVTQPVSADGQVVGVAGTQGGKAFTARARLTILATGANIGLLKAFGVLSTMPPGVNAVRGYYRGVADLGKEFEFYFENEIVPGYAWVFPLSDGRANVGVGYFARSGDGKTPDVKRMLTDFLARHARFSDATPEGPVKGFPLRTDFPSHAASGPGFLILGESLGLVNPATGEGIDFAMESAELAAEAAAAALAGKDTTRRSLLRYDRLLERRYGSLFRGLQVVKHLAMGPRGISILVHKAQTRPHLARVIAGVTLGTISPWAAFAPRVWWDILR
ncbi:MAG TPA: geranylgeranyl reductase family protein [Anaerolineae bacterium]